ncbi:hypothetical protein MKX03_025461 [Papaver bracteatum]|nr:hypothetical protein MKX03_025461 [Papaver bracteatum]
MVLNKSFMNQDLRAFLKWDVVHLDFTFRYKLYATVILFCFCVTYNFDCSPVLIRHWFIESWSSILILLNFLCDHTDPFIHFRLVFVSCEIFTCETEVILKALVDNDEGLLSSFLGPNHLHSPLLVGYFSKLHKLLKVYHGYDHKLYFGLC